MPLSYFIVFRANIDLLSNLNAVYDECETWQDAVNFFSNEEHALIENKRVKYTAEEQMMAKTILACGIDALTKEQDFECDISSFMVDEDCISSLLNCISEVTYEDVLEKSTQNTSDR